MKKNFWKPLALGLLAILLIVGTATAASAVAGSEPDQSSYTFYLDGKKIELEGVMYEGYNYLKLRDILKALDMNVEYDADTQTVRIDSKTPYKDPNEGYNDVTYKNATKSPSDPDYYLDVWAAEVYNLRMIRNFPTLYTDESWKNYQAKCGNLLTMDIENMSDRDKAALDAMVAARAELVQIKPLEAGIYGEVIYIWGDKMATSTPADDLTVEAFDSPKAILSNTYDNYGFAPFIVPYLAADQENCKGNIVMASGGGNWSRSNPTECYRVAPVFQEKGYNVWLLQRRVSPYISTDIVADFQRAVRVVKNLVAENNLGAGDVVCGFGFSGSGGNLKQMIDTAYGSITPDTWDPTYVCDEIDAINSDLDVAVFTYSGSPLDPESGNNNIPHIWIGVGEDDTLGGGCLKLYDQLKNGGYKQYENVNPEFHVFAENGHGYGSGIPMTTSALWMDLADIYIQRVMGKAIYKVEGEIPEEFKLHQQISFTRNSVAYPVDVYVTADFSRYLYVYNMYNSDFAISGPIISGKAQMPENDPTAGMFTKYGDYLNMWNLCDQSAWETEDVWRK